MKTTISVSVDKDTKALAQVLAKSMGLTLSTLVNSYLKQVVITRRVEIFAPEPMTPKMEKLIGEAEKEIALGETVGPFDNVEDFIAALKHPEDD